MTSNIEQDIVLLSQICERLSKEKPEDVAEHLDSLFEVFDDIEGVLNTAYRSRFHG